MYIVEDYPSSSKAIDVVRINLLLNDLKVLLLQHWKHITEYDLPIATTASEQISAIPRIIQDEINIPVVDEEINFLDKLNHDQRVAYNTIMGVIERKESMIFFVDRPGGIGKLFLYRTLLANLRKLGHIAIATATSVIATTLLPGGRIAHSRFKIPLTPDALSTCSISIQSDLAELIRRAIVVVWDEAPMVNRRAVETFNRTLKNIMKVDSPFGENVVIFGKDFRQVLHVIPNGTRSEMIDACIVKSPLWRYVKVLHLKYNMRIINDEHFAKYVQRTGDGNEPFTKDDLVKVPSSMAIQWEGEHSVYNLIEEVFPDLHNHGSDAKYMVDKALSNK
ncbi:ATP-dependent DNA helicase PIF1-like [Fagus crenata]